MAKDKRKYTGPVIAGPLEMESPVCEDCPEGRTESDLVYKVSNGDWFHAECYESN